MNQQKKLLYTVYFVYFIGGLAQCFEGVFLPEFKDTFNLSYTEQMFTMFAKNMPFILFSVAIGYYLKKIGYKNALIISLLLLALGTAIIVPGLNNNKYYLVLGAFFILGTAFNFGLVAGNPMLAALGDEKGAASRLNIGNALGAVAQIFAPLIIVLVMPRSAILVKDKLPYMNGIFIVTALILVATAIVIFFVKDIAADIMSSHKESGLTTINTAQKSVWKESKVVLGFVSIFLIVGVEAGLFGLYRNYLEDPGNIGLSSYQSQQMFTVYFASFAAGRLAGAWIQKKIAATTTMLYSLFIAMLIVLIVIFAKGITAMVAVTMLGFFVSIFFPTVYALAIEGLGERTGQASGILNMGFLGSALLPVLQGKLADLFSLPTSYSIAILPYAFVVYYVMRIKSDKNKIIHTTAI